MGIQSLMQNLVLEEFAAIPLGTLLRALILSFLFGLFVVAVYRATYAGVLFQKSFAMGLVLLSMITSLVILTISSNIVLSLGMVGALSIVRFRTAVKEPMDTIFMFWAIVVGIITGAGYVLVALIATLLIGGLFLLLNTLGFRANTAVYLAVLRFDAAAETQVQTVLNELPRYKLRSKNMAGDRIELVLELKLTAQLTEKLTDLREINGVHEVNLISYNGGTTL